jgi:tRNA threonylcarbamoyladenosine biosynthesis protein TsaE
MEIIFKLNEIDKAVNTFLETAGNHKCFAFHGEMGAGKTTFISSVCEQLGVKNGLGSPTFSIINEYSTSGGVSIYHIDLYRLKDLEEAVAAGVEDCIYSGNYCFVEWPGKAEGIFDDDVVHCFISVVGQDTRKLKLIL